MESNMHERAIKRQRVQRVRYRGIDLVRPFQTRFSGNKKRIERFPFGELRGKVLRDLNGSSEFHLLLNEFLFALLLFEAFKFFWSGSRFTYEVE